MNEREYQLQASLDALAGLVTLEADCGPKGIAYDAHLYAEAMTEQARKRGLFDDPADDGRTVIPSTPAPMHPLPDFKTPAEISDPWADANSPWDEIKRLKDQRAKDNAAWDKTVEERDEARKLVAEMAALLLSAPALSHTTPWVERRDNLIRRAKEMNND